LSETSQVDVAEPVRLVPVTIAKPWGQEIWYTGIEARGESRVVTSTGETSLSAYLDLDRAATCNDQEIVLLKVLDPNPSPVIGDLYFEVHEEKREVYVVTAIDPQAWPGGRAHMRFGMNQQLRASFGDDDAFRAAYLNAVKDYEQVRRAIDSGNQNLDDTELAKRAAMDAFTATTTLEIGEVIAIPRWVPHSLQHGVRVIEFQTPTYERQIISFAQQVLTQDHWDSEHAIKHMNVEPVAAPTFEQVAKGVERIAAFDDFGVWRATVEPGIPFAMPDGIPYAICTPLDGDVAVGSLPLTREQACLVPTAGLATTHITTTTKARCLIAAPGL
jgi:hypothetical protein